MKTDPRWVILVFLHSSQSDKKDWWEEEAPVLAPRSLVQAELNGARAVTGSHFKIPAKASTNSQLSLALGLTSVVQPLY
ncbi:hypothetical protein RRG08_006243 [Elysia crispata]|uniref:Uncharacterized protein n=1 Tax=Elysia crispata TaxID=231223 RepID=A0AAE1D2B5_9GAST|nr:hypothetical protein RRG08_006243 [Elysia crispata]